MATSDLPLSGVKVLDLSRLLAGPFSTQTLGDFGADVFKIERPGRGDEFRHYGPPFLTDDQGNVSPGAPEAGGYLAMNRNKKSLAIDFSKPEGAALIREMVRDCDIFVENFKVGTLARYGLDFDSIRAVNPRIIYVSVTGFGQTGPYASRPGTDIVFQAMTGLMSITGEPDGPPMRSGVLLSDMLCGFNAAIAMLLALRRRDAGYQEAQQLDISLLSASLAAMSTRAQHYLMTGEVPQRSGNTNAASVPAQVFECADGQLSIQASTDSDFLRLCAVLGVPELPADSRYTTRPQRVINKDTLIPLLSDILFTRGVQHWYGELVEADIICAPIYNFEQALDDPQVRHLDVIKRAEHPLTDTLELLASPIRISGVDVPYEAPPQLGQHTLEVLRGQFAVPDDRIDALHAAGIL
jgi:crotonobetainyl-CoA:carnitine CoA-transferase CaiB-like acyl-CoA transferase